MNNLGLGSRVSVAALAMTIWLLPVAAFAQKTQIVAPKNKYKVEEDVKLGLQAAAQVEKQFPLINDRDAAAYVERVGQRLIAAIPPQFHHPEFKYRFKWVNASDINAFALPGGPMYVNRGMIEAAKNEGEVAGVMAHEISHVALRHATAQATKQSSTKGILSQLPMIAGGILAGDAGAQLGSIATGALTTKYSREYESQSDILGAQIMAAAGYDPRDLANMFKTIQGESKGGGMPGWLSSHPDPGNRFTKINDEASRLQISSNPIKVTRDFQSTQTRFRALPKARSMAEIEKGPPAGNTSVDQLPPEPGGGNPTQGGGTAPPTGKYAKSVPAPSLRTRAYSKIDWLTINVPTNWLDQPGQNDVTFAPEGANGEQGITHGVMMGIYSGKNKDLTADSKDYVREIMQGNSYLQQRGNATQATVNARQAYSIPLAGKSPVTGKTELVTIYTTLLKNGELFYAITVVPEDESASYSTAFRNMLRSIQLND